MDKESKHEPSREKQGSSSSASAPIDKMSDNVREQKSKKLAQENRPSEKGAAGDKPQHSMTKKGETGNVNDPKEAVGSPTQPGKPPERTPDHPRDSAAKV